MFSRLPLIVRLVLALLAAAMLPLAISFYQLKSNQDALRDQVSRTHLIAASTTAARIGAHVGRLRSLAAALATNAEVIRDPQSPAVQQLFAGTLQAESELAMAGLFDPGWEMVVQVQRRDLRDDVAPVVADRATEPVTLVDGVTRRWLRLVEPLVGAGGEPLGRLLLVAEVEPVAAMTRLRELPEEAELLVAGSDGEVLFPRGMVPDAGLAEVMTRARTRKVGETTRLRLDDGDQLVAYEPIAGTPWYVLSRQSAARAELARAGIWRATAVAVTGAALLTLLFSVFGYTTFVRPFRQVVEAQSRLAGISPEDMRGSELARLQASLEVLEQRIRDHEQLGKIFLGRYQVLGVAGKGSMGHVFRSWDPALKREVALKTIRLDADEEKREKLTGRLLKEAVTYARFNHPNIVTVYDVASQGSAAFIAMELIEGTTLEPYFELYAPLPPDEVIVLGAAITRALATAHEHGLIHQDVKPGNVLISQDGAIKVTDFGISQLATSTMPEGGVVTGTPGYIAPETLMGEGYSPSGDLFALGVVLYEALTGQVPFAGGNIQEIAIDTISREPKAITSLNPDVPPELADLVMQLMAKDPEDRPASATIVARTFEEWVDARRLAWKPQPLPVEPPDPLTSLPTDELAASLGA